MNNIILTGFMGTGKTTVSKCLKRVFGLEVLDTDTEIERREGRTIPEIFEVEGEEYFRERETELLRELRAKENIVISCGGGTVLRTCNVELLKESGTVFLLSATPETIFERVKNSHHRPLLEQNKSVEGIRALLEQRNSRYQAAADVIVSIEGKTTEQICREILKRRDYRNVK